MSAKSLNLGIFLTLAWTVAAPADDLTVKLINNTGEAIMSVAATPQDAAEPSAANVLSGEVAASDEGMMTIPREAEECLFDLQIAFAGGTVSDRPDLDLCQADGIVIE